MQCKNVGFYLKLVCRNYLLTYWKIIDKCNIYYGRVHNLNRIQLIRGRLTLWLSLCIFFSLRFITLLLSTALSTALNIAISVEMIGMRHTDFLLKVELPWV